MDLKEVKDFLEYFDNVEEVSENRVHKRCICDAENPIEFYEDQAFCYRYRFSKTFVLNVLLPLVANSLDSEPVSPLIQLLTSLRYYATGDFQLVNGDLRGISRESVSLIIKNVSEGIARHLRDYIQHPKYLEQKQRNVRLFQAIAGFPGVAACVDCMHIKIANIGDHKEYVFTNRRGIFSLNIQIAVGPQREMIDIVARYPGASTDGIIYDRSYLRVACEKGEMGGVLLADRGYPKKRPNLLTPIVHPASARDERFNKAHKGTMEVIERAFGNYKRRFPCLHRGLTTELTTSPAVICATTTLYNLGLKYKDNITCEEESLEN
ncbi:putative nuclease HARBI1 [Sitophilus oryzae]|uniref:Nuclease HARBI1 n=1 Tax=Sitophilus oryzae TaxID=7048 RepID=A0A6J2XEH5_SITOR|nr:putative nuclease HARBI1 [Sitophilus oryzae]